MNLILRVLLIKAYREFNRILVISIESSKVEIGYFIYKSNIFLYIYLLSYILSKLLLIISNSNKGLNL